MKCHLVYAIPLVHSSLGSRVKRKARRAFQDIGLPVGLLSNRQPTRTDLGSWPIKSPYENTRNLYCAIMRRAPTLLYDLTERVKCHFEPDDVFLGHPFFPHEEGRYGVTELAARQRRRPRTFALICPLHSNLSIGGNHINKQFLDDVDRLMPYADVLFGIMGEYWWDQWDFSSFSRWKSKMVRVDMAINVEHYPRVKRGFNQPGRRGYLYIGVNEPRKGTDFLSRLMKELSDHPRGWIGDGPEIEHVPRISTARPLTPEFMADIADKYDFFVTPARADPNPTTILESMAWGFPVVCTPQSGYYKTSYRKNIYLDDIDESLKVLADLQFADESELRKMADDARKTVERDYTWDRFTSTVIRQLGL